MFPPKFGTDGIRGVFGNQITPLLARCLGYAACEVLAKASRNPTVVVCRDTRFSGVELCVELCAGIIDAGGSVIDFGVAPTAVACFALANLQADFAIVISASHNTSHYNGFKFFAKGGKKLTEKEQEQIEQKLNNSMADLLQSANRPTIYQKGKSGIAHKQIAAGCVDEYLEYIRQSVHLFLSQGESESTFDLGSFQIIVDCANGAATELAPRVFQSAAHIYTIASNPDGYNINAGCGSTHLEFLQTYMKRAREQGAPIGAGDKEANIDGQIETGEIEIGKIGAESDPHTGRHLIGVAFDGDADRCVFVDAFGRVIGGDRILVLIARFLKAHGRLANNTVVLSVLSNYATVKALEAEGICVYMADVGDRNLVQLMEETGAVLGCEPSGHLVYLPFLSTGCGLFTASIVLSIAAAFLKGEWRVEGAQTFQDLLLGGIEDFPQLSVDIQAQDPHTFKGCVFAGRDL